MAVAATKEYILGKFAEVNAMTRKQRQEFMRDHYNATPGNLDPEEYDCKKCLNRGNIMVLDEDNDYQEHIVECSCMLIRRSIWSAKASGLYTRLRRCDFPGYAVKEKWQQEMKDTAKAFAKAEGKPWLLLCGQSGSGKTHLALAACGYKLAHRFETIRFLDWRNFNSLREDDPDKVSYQDALDKALKAPILFIDDLLKLEKGRTFYPSKEVEAAFQIINHRENQDLQTLISTELTPRQLLEVDEALGSRILKKARDYTCTVEKDVKKNHRLHTR